MISASLPSSAGAARVSVASFFHLRKEALVRVVRHKKRGCDNFIKEQHTIGTTTNSIVILDSTYTLIVKL